MDINELEDQVIIVDFEGRPPVDSDHDGITFLLSNQMKLVRSCVTLRDLASLIIEQNFVGVVLKQDVDDHPNGGGGNAITRSEEGDANDEESDGEDETVYGVLSAIGLSSRPGRQSVDQISALLLSLAQTHADSQNLKEFSKVLAARNDEPVALVVNERISNLPSEAARPMFQSLIVDIDKAKKDNSHFAFKHYILLVKFDEDTEDTASDVTLYYEERLLKERCCASFVVKRPAENEDEPDAGHNYRIVLLKDEAFREFVNMT